MLKPIFLAILQAATEFFPVSSSGHLVIAGSYFRSGISSPLLFIITLHLGTLLATLLYFRRKVAEVISLKDRNLLKYLIISSVFTALVAIPIHDYVEKKVSDPFSAGKALLINGMILSTLFIIRKRRERNIGSAEAILIGIAQGIAVIPGISRSGITITSAIHLGVKEKEAFEYSFLLSVPVMIGAELFEILKRGFPSGGERDIYLLGGGVSFLFSLLSLRLLESVIVKGYFKYFAFYSFFIGSVVIFYYG